MPPGDPPVPQLDSPGHKGHLGQRSFSKYLPKRGNANQSDNRQLEGKHGSSAVFVEAFTCLWALWREKVEADTASKLAEVQLPQACVPEWLGMLSLLFHTAYDCSVNYVEPTVPPSTCVQNDL